MAIYIHLPFGNQHGKLVIVLKTCILWVNFTTASHLHITYIYDILPFLLVGQMQIYYIVYYCLSAVSKCVWVRCDKRRCSDIAWKFNLHCDDVLHIDWGSQAFSACLPPFFPRLLACCSLLTIRGFSSSTSPPCNWSLLTIWLSEMISSVIFPWKTDGNNRAFPSH